MKIRTPTMVIICLKKSSIDTINNSKYNHCSIKAFPAFNEKRKVTFTCQKLQNKSEVLSLLCTPLTLPHPQVGHSLTKLCPKDFDKKDTIQIFVKELQNTNIISTNPPKSNNTKQDK